MTDPTHIARGIAPCWGNGVNGPKECTQDQKCELHFRLAAALREYGEAKKCEGIDEAEGLFDSKYKQADAEGFARGDSQGFRRGVEESAVVAFDSCEHTQSKRICVCSREIRKLLQRGTGDGDWSFCSLVRNYLSGI